MEYENVNLSNFRSLRNDSFYEVVPFRSRVDKSDPKFLR